MDPHGSLQMSPHRTGPHDTGPFAELIVILCIKYILIVCHISMYANAKERPKRPSLCIMVKGPFILS